MLDRYVAQVRLLLSVLPDIATEAVFALKGGTAINLFYRDMPRLSVDIDLTYLPVADRQSSLEDMDDAFSRIVTAITERNPRVKARRIAGGGDNDTRIMVSDGPAQIKIETSPVTRGAVFPARTMVASESVTEQFGFVETNVLAFEDLYGGKLHAAFDRQHPRDLFDVKLLYENEGLTDDLFRVFMVYVASSGRPMHELLAPARPYREDLSRSKQGLPIREETIYGLAAGVTRVPTNGSVDILQFRAPRVAHRHIERGEIGWSRTLGAGRRGVRRGRRIRSSEDTRGRNIVFFGV